MSSQGTINGSQPKYNRENDLKAFDERKTGVKGLVDAGIEKIPHIFIRSPEDRDKEFNTSHENNLSVPVIDLADHVYQRNNDRFKEEIIKEILWASENWGFFQVINHGIPLEVVERMIEGVRMFHEQDVEIKKQFYSRDQSKGVKFNTNYDFYKSKAANWRDSLNACSTFSGLLDPQDLPPICRDVTMDYIDHMIKLGNQLLELISVGLGLEPGYIGDMQCTKGRNLVCHYYPPCPEPQLTLGASQHSDPSFITILLQDQIGGLQVLHQNHWVHVKPIHGALIVNIGDILQIISNDKLKSVCHRVIANRAGPRISVPFFFSGLFSSPKIYGPIKELITEQHQPIYREFTLKEFFMYFLSRSLDQPGIEYFKI